MEKHYKSTPARRASWAAYRAKHLEKRREATRQYRRNNPIAVIESTRKANQKRKGRLSWRLGYTLRNRIRIALKNSQKSGSAVADLGCSVVELKAYIENKFQSGMTWDNWGKDGWHLDHIVPLCAFDLSDREQFLRAAHYTNLQPLWVRDNLYKGGKYVRAA